MSEKKLTVLQTRKRLLLAESEINRLLLLQERDALLREVHQVTEPLRHMGSIFSTVAAGMALFKEFRRGRETGDRKGFSWFSSGLVRMVLAFLTGRKPDEAGSDHEPEAAEMTAK